MSIQLESDSLKAARGVAALAVAEVHHPGERPSGFYDTVDLNGVSIDVAASAGWGVQLSRTVAGVLTTKHLDPSAVTDVDDVLTALAVIANG